MTGVFRGRGGEIRKGHAVAAVLADYTLERSVHHDGIALTATVTRSDAFLLSQRGVSLVVVRQNGARWIWRVRSLQVAGDRLTAVLDSQETSHEQTQSLRVDGVGPPAAVGR